MNKAIYKGRITASPELRSSTTGKSYCRFTIAVDGFKDKSEGKQADFIPCIAWNGTAETIAKFVEKGQELLVEGSMKSRSYNDTKHPDIKHYTLECFVERFEFCGSKSCRTESSEATAQPSQSQKASQPEQDLPEGYEELLSGDDMPF